MTRPFRLHAVQTTPTGPVRIRSGEACLQGTFFAPAGTPKAIVVIHPATGVPQRYYADFARWLATEKAVAVLTYDFRDFGASARGPLHLSRATMVDWGVHDQTAARRFAAKMFPHTPLWIIGHSLGGFMLPFQPDAGQVAGLITVASGPVHLRDHPWWYKPAAGLLWSPIIGAVSRGLGYLPGKRIGLGADLPIGVYLQWRR